jgi:hypothetical protein
MAAAIAREGLASLPLSRKSGMAGGAYTRQWHLASRRHAKPSPRVCDGNLQLDGPGAGPKTAVFQGAERRRTIALKAAVPTIFSGKKTGRGPRQFQNLQNQVRGKIRAGFWSVRRISFVKRFRINTIFKRESQEARAVISLRRVLAGERGEDERRAAG